MTDLRVTVTEDGLEFEEVHEPHKPAPGEVCPTCERRVNYPKKESSPKSRVKSFRIPEENADFDQHFLEACLTVGITTAHKYPIFKFLDWVTDVILSDPDRWQGAYGREENP